MAEGRDSYFRNANGAIIVREGGSRSPWLVTWLPDDESDPSYPGSTLSSTLGEVPKGPTVEAVLQWAAQQPWANRPARQAAVAPDEVPVAESGDLRHFEFRIQLGFTGELDGSYSWAVYSGTDEQMSSGVADTWDDARLAAIEHLYPPSGEQ